jgi:hypothetical protein
MASINTFQIRGRSMKVLALLWLIVQGFVSELMMIGAASNKQKIHKQEGLL